MPLDAVRWLDMLQLLSAPLKSGGRLEQIAHRLSSVVDTRAQSKMLIDMADPALVE